MSDRTDVHPDMLVATVNGHTGHWSNKQAPQIGDRVLITFNRFGKGTIIGAFTEAGYLGVIVKCDQRPEWHIKQNGDKHIHPHVFGAEVEFLA